MCFVWAESISPLSSLCGMTLGSCPSSDPNSAREENNRRVFILFSSLLSLSPALVFCLRYSSFFVAFLLVSFLLLAHPPFFFSPLHSSRLLMFLFILFLFHQSLSSSSPPFFLFFPFSLFFSSIPPFISCLSILFPSFFFSSCLSSTFMSHSSFLSFIFSSSFFSSPFSLLLSFSLLLVRLLSCPLSLLTSPPVFSLFPSSFLSFPFSSFFSSPPLQLHFHPFVPFLFSTLFISSPLTLPFLLFYTFFSPCPLFAPLLWLTELSYLFSIVLEFL